MNIKIFQNKEIKIDIMIIYFLYKMYGYLFMIKE